MEPLEQRLAIARSSIIQSVLTEGIYSSKLLIDQRKLHIASHDGRVHDFVCAADFHPREDSSEEDEIIADGLYFAYESAIPVLLERAGGNGRFFPNGLSSSLDEEAIETFNRRLSASFMIISRASKWRGALDNFKGPKVFDKVVFPEAIWSQYQTLKPVLPLVEYEVVGLIQRKIAFLETLFNVPNYEATIKRALQEYREVVYGHVITLPADEEDLLEFLASK